MRIILLALTSFVIGCDSPDVEKPTVEKKETGKKKDDGSWYFSPANAANPLNPANPYTYPTFPGGMTGTGTGVGF